MWILLVVGHLARDKVGGLSRGHAADHVQTVPHLVRVGEENHVDNVSLVLHDVVVSGVSVSVPSLRSRTDQDFGTSGFELCPGGFGDKMCFESDVGSDAR